MAKMLLAFRANVVERDVLAFAIEQDIVADKTASSADDW